MARGVKSHETTFDQALSGWWQLGLTCLWSCFPGLEQKAFGNRRKRCKKKVELAADVTPFARRELDRGDGRMCRHARGNSTSRRGRLGHVSVVTGPLSEISNLALVGRSRVRVEHLACGNVLPLDRETRCRCGISRPLTLLGRGFSDHYCLAYPHLVRPGSRNPTIITTWRALRGR